MKTCEDIRKDCIATCLSNTRGRCTKSEEEFYDTSCTFLWWLTGSNKPVKEILEEGYGFRLVKEKRELSFKGDKTQ